MKLLDYQKSVDDYLSQYEEGYWEIKGIMLRLVEENELKKIMIKTLGKYNSRDKNL